jgi:hypothetical protein
MTTQYTPTGLEVDGLPISLTPDNSTTNERYTIHLGTGRIGVIWRYGKGDWHRSIRLVDLTNEQINNTLGN